MKVLWLLGVVTTLHFAAQAAVHSQRDHRHGDRR